MLDFDASKLLIIGVVALVVIGPKDLPRVLRQVGQMVGKLRRMAGEFQGQFMDAMKEADLQDLRDEVAKIKNTASLDVDFNPVRDATAELSKAMEGVAAPIGEVSSRGKKDFGFTPAPAPAPSTNLVGAGIAPVAEFPLTEPSAEALVLTKPQDEVVLHEQDQAFLHGPEREVLPDLSASVAHADIGLSRRKVRIPKRRPPGDRTTPVIQRSAAVWRSRSYCPPRREIPTS